VIETVTSAFEIAAYVADIFGLSLLVVGFIRGAVGWLRTEIAREPWEQRLRSIRALRCVVGVHILYALELMIVSDIIDSFVAVARHEGDHGDFFHGEVFYSLVQLGMIVLIRTVIDYFLGREINELDVVDTRAG
jgi:uncharacterized membrane protein